MLPRSLQWLLFEKCYPNSLPHFSPAGVRSFSWKTRKSRSFSRIASEKILCVPVLNRPLDTTLSHFFVMSRLIGFVVPRLAAMAFCINAPLLFPRAVGGGAPHAFGRSFYPIQQLQDPSCAPITVVELRHSLLSHMSLLQFRHVPSLSHDFRQISHPILAFTVKFNIESLFVKENESACCLSTPRKRVNRRLSLS